MEKYCECGDHLYDHLIYCPFCGKIKISDTDLLDYLLKKYTLHYEELKQEYINEIENKTESE